MRIFILMSLLISTKREGGNIMEVKGMCTYEKDIKSIYKDEDCHSCIHDKNKNDPCPYIISWRKYKGDYKELRQFLVEGEKYDKGVVR